VVVAHLVEDRSQLQLLKKNILKVLLFSNFHRILQLFTTINSNQAIKNMRFDPESEIRDPENTYSGILSMIKKVPNLVTGFARLQFSIICDANTFPTFFLFPTNVT
jgi:hypothetical protein